MVTCKGDGKYQNWMPKNLSKLFKDEEWYDQMLCYAWTYKNSNLNYSKNAIKHDGMQKKQTKCTTKKTMQIDHAFTL